MTCFIRQVHIKNPIFLKHVTCIKNGPFKRISLGMSVVQQPVKPLLALSTTCFRVPVLNLAPFLI